MTETTQDLALGGQDDGDLGVARIPAPAGPVERLTLWLRSQIAAEHARIVLWAPVVLAIGIAAHFQLDHQPPWYLGVLGLSAGGLCWLARFRLLRHLGLWFAILSLGFTAAQWRTAQVAGPMLGDQTRPTFVEGTVVSVDRLERGGRMLLRDISVERLRYAETPTRVRIRLRGGENVVMPAPGQRIRVLAILTPPSEPAEPDAFDFRRHAYFQRIGAVGFALRDIEVVAGVEPSGWVGLVAGLERLRNHIADRVDLRLSGAEGAVSTALLTGQTTAIPDEDLEAMRISGLQHLLSISGLHIGLVAGLIFFAVRAGLALIPRIAVRYPIKKWAGCAALLAAFGYMLLVGSPVPTQRAVLMTGVMLLAVLVDRSPFSMRVVATAATVILLLQPEALVGPSFQMSFAAVIALIAAYESLRGRFSPDGDAGVVRRAALYVVGLSVTSLVAGGATTPFAVYHFQQMANYGVLANLIAVPITSFWVMPFGVLALVLMPFGLEGWAIHAMGWGVSGILWTAHWVAGLPAAAFHLPAMPVWGLAVLSLGGAWLVIWTRPWRYAGVVLVAAGIASMWIATRPDLLVEGEGKLVGVRAPDGRLWVSSGRAAKFEAAIWLERDGGTGKPQAWGRTGTPDGWVTCDPAGCTTDVRGLPIAIVHTVDALAEDCRRAHIIISKVEPVDCAAPIVIGPSALAAGGAHALYIRDDGVRVLTSRAARRAWPWN